MTLRERLFDNLNYNIEKFKRNIILKNVLLNKKFLSASLSFNHIQKIIKNKDVIIAGAGPQLEEEINTLKKLYLRKSVILISVDLALKPLLKYGIIPDLVITCETTRINYFKGVKTDNLILCAFIGANNGNIRDFKGKYFFYNWNVPGSKLFNIEIPFKIGFPLPVLETASTVTTQAISLAVKTNARRIILIGSEFSFTEKYYCKGTLYEETYLKYNNKFVSYTQINDLHIIWNTHYLVKYKDKVLKTNHQMLAAKLWLEKYLPLTRKRVVNSAENSILKKGIIVAGLKEEFGLK